MIPLALIVAASSADFARLDQRQLNVISDECHTPHSWLRKDETGVHLRPAFTARFERVDCILQKLRQRHAGKVGFIGNEAYRPPKP